MDLRIPVSDLLGLNSGVVALTDVPINGTTGNLINSAGDIQGTITYATGAIEVTPVLIKKQFKQIYMSAAVYGSA